MQSNRLNKEIDQLLTLIDIKEDTNKTELASIIRKNPIIITETYNVIENLLNNDITFKLRYYTSQQLYTKTIVLEVVTDDKTTREIIHREYNSNKNQLTRGLTLLGHLVETDTYNDINKIPVTKQAIIKRSVC